MTAAVLYLALLAYAPLVFSTIRAASREKLRDRVFLRTIAKDYLRTLPTLALASLPVVAFPAYTRAYVVGMHLVFMPLAMLELGHVWMFGARMGLNTFYSLFVTNMQETAEYIRNNLAKSQLILALAVYFLPLAALWRLQPVVFASRWTRLAWAAGLVALAVPLVRNFFRKGPRRKTGYVLNPFVSVFYHYALYRRQYCELRRQIAAHAAPRFEGIRSSVPADVPETYVVCIGESANSMHCSYAGYSRRTNEFTEAVEGLRSYTGVRSQYAQTLPSLEKAITFATDAEPDLLFRKGSIVDYFRDAGFKVFWLSNQYALEDTAITAMAGHADVVKCCNYSSMKGFETAGYDGALLPEFERVLDDPAPKKAVFLHMIGSHSAYVNRYPAEFRRFEGAAPGKEGLSASATELLNSYDDSIRYTDWVIAELVKRLAVRGGSAAESLVYFADHGEDCFDTSADKILGHSQLANVPMTSVPLQVWLSPRLVELRPGLAARAAHPKKSYRLEQIVHLLIDVASLSNPDFSPEDSLFPKEQPPE
ncbi:MAG: sulfatase-like hydrolase/transferase [Kiritimatiellae bacterium]|nr:sulfatase-like hydrolase/transferase [Kiritimatiellia bacterium]